MSNNTRILLVEDDDKLRNTIEDYLQMNKFEITACADGKSALHSFEKEPPFDIILLDGMLPDIDGFEVLKRIRETSDIPVIILSARESERDQLNGFHLGADNYITKPFLLSVLKEHINALLSRLGNFNKNKAQITKGALCLNTTERKVYLDDNLILTTPREYDLLLFFMQNERIVLSRDTILDRVWGNGYFGDLRTVDTIVKQLRKKLGKHDEYIVSVYGIGYKFEVNDEE
ncbi:MAG: response regulator transcription factor [Ruminococcaceae bacterium]|nr:response regulator transcription factor [Oscillospiraceae bacterium]